MEDAARVDIFIEPVEPHEVGSHGLQVAEREAVVVAPPVRERRHTPARTLERLGRHAEREVGPAPHDDIGFDAARLKHLPDATQPPELLEHPLHPVAAAIHLPRILPPLRHLVLRLDHRDRRAKQERFLGVIVGDGVYHKRYIGIDRSDAGGTLVGRSHLPADEHDGFHGRRIQILAPCRTNVEHQRQSHAGSCPSSA